MLTILLEKLGVSVLDLDSQSIVVEKSPDQLLPWI